MSVDPLPPAAVEKAARALNAETERQITSGRKEADFDALARAALAAAREREERLERERDELDAKADRWVGQANAANDDAERLTDRAKQAEAQNERLRETLREAMDALDMYVQGIEQQRHWQGRGRMAAYHASSSAGGRKAIAAIDAALSPSEQSREG